jgi:hypothetical protein
LAHATGGDDECDDQSCTSFFAPEIIHHPDESPFFLTNRFYYQHAEDIGSDPLHNTAAVNLGEWARYFDGALKPGTVQWMLYQMTLADLQNLRSVWEGKNASLSDRAKILLKLFQSYGHKSKVDQSLRYLEFAKKVEPIANRRSGDDAWDTHALQKHLAEDQAAARELLASVPTLLREEDSFLSSRLKFQVLRLYFYTAQYIEAQNYYEANATSLAAQGSVKWRFLEIAAGAFYKDKKYGTANYLYSLVFDHFTPEKRNAFFSFHPMEQSDWNETLSLAKSKREKEVLWQLLGIYADGLTAIDQIIAADPHSDLIPLLLVREVNKAEEDWSSNRDQIQYTVDPNLKPKSDAEAVGIARLAKLKEITDAGKVGQLYLWRLSVGHLLALSGDYAAAELYIRQSAENMPKDALVRAQARQSFLLNRVLALKSVDSRSEDFLAHELTWLRKFQSDRNFRAQHLNQWILADLSKLYFAAGDTVRGLMLTDHASNPAYRDEKAIAAILSFQQRAHTPFDQYLVGNYQYNAKELHHLQAIDALYQGRLETAKAFLALSGDKGLSSPIFANPFSDRIVDCHDCEIQEKPVLTLGAFVDRMIALEAASRGIGNAAAEASLQLGNAFYNMTYYGNGRSIYATDHGNFTVDRFEDKNMDSVPNMNMDLAERAYEQAASLSSDPEFRARATFLAAKAEQNRYYNTHPEWDGTDIHPGKYYAQLKAEFSKTQYFQEIIQECGYFKRYLGR